MTQSKENLKNKLQTEYLKLVKKSIQIQKKGDIQAYTIVAFQAESVAEKIKAISRNN